jgi:chain length determinant protein EpsF
MTFKQFLLILWARKWVIVSMALLGVLMALAVSWVLPPRYRAQTEVVIDYKTSDPVSGMVLPSTMMPGYLATQLDIIESHRTALKVVRNLQLPNQSFAREQFMQATGGKGSIDDWLADLLLASLDVFPSQTSSVITLRYTSPEPQFSAILADAFAKAYIDTTLELRVDPAKETAVWFDDQIRTLRENLAAAQAKLSAYQRGHGYSATDERLDVESSKLSEISGQLVNAQAAMSDTAARKQQLDDFLAKGRSPETLPDILGNSMIQSLKTQISMAEAKREQILSDKGRNHPDYIKTGAELDSLRQKLSDEIKNVSAAIGNAHRISQRRVGELSAAAGGQKHRMLELNKGRDEMMVLIKEVENAQRALDAANARLTQETLQSRSSQATVMILSPAVIPLYPFFPNMTLNLPLGLLAGLFLGLNLALLREFFDRRIRSDQDLTDALGMTVLGKLAVVKHTRPRRIAWRRRAPAIGTASA